MYQKDGLPLPSYLDFSTVAWKYFGLDSSWFPGDCSGYFRILNNIPAFSPPVTSITLVSSCDKNKNISKSSLSGKEKKKKNYTPGLQSQELSFVKIPELSCSLGSLVLEMAAQDFSLDILQCYLSCPQRPARMFMQVALGHSLFSFTFSCV